MKFSLYQGGGFESANVNGLWFAGTLMHGNDWRRSSGGFIHGFRYLVRSLGKILELENHAVAWPSRSISVEPARVSGEPAGDTQMRRYVELATAILKRSSESSGPYQMFGVLMDVRNLLCFYTAFSSICTLFCSNLTLFDSLVYSTLPSTVRFTCSARTGAASGTCIYAVCFVCTCRRLIGLSLCLQVPRRKQRRKPPQLQLLIPGHDHRLAPEVVRVSAVLLRLPAVFYRVFVCQT